MVTCVATQRLLTINRGHWTIQSVHNIIDWNYDENRSRIRTGHGPENITRPAALRGRHLQALSEAH